MCLILFAYEVHPRFRLVVAANRDEYYRRPTKKAGYWQDRPDILAGRDLVRMGTWLGITKKGRFAAVTNFREPLILGETARSRGELVKNFLWGNDAPNHYLEKVHRQNDCYGGFNLLAGDLSSLWYYSNRQHRVKQIVPGIYGLSNHLLDTPWPKTLKGKEALKKSIDSGETSPELPFDILSDTTRAEDHELPDTGVGLAWERILSAIMIKSREYGTRSSTVILIDRQNQVTFIERNYDNQAEENKYEFSIALGHA
jgi:uncharacterized protein with NRDE domain